MDVPDLDAALEITGRVARDDRREMEEFEPAGTKVA